MKNRLLSMILALALCLTLLPTAALAAGPAEQFSGLTPGETYWFDLSGADIPGTVNGGNHYGAVAVPDKTLHWVPFTYAGTVDAYVLNESSNGVANASEAAANTTSPDGQYGYTYDHSLFIADYAVTQPVSWDALNGENLIFGKSYNSGGVGYTLRAPSAGSNGPTDNTLPSAPASNEWDAISDKNSVDIKNWERMYSWGQDTAADQANTSYRSSRGYFSARFWNCFNAYQNAFLGFRPVLELPSADTLGADGLTTVTLDLNGGSIGTVQGHITTGEIHLVTKKGDSYTAPSGVGLTRPTGNTGTYFKWQDSSGNRYEPGDTVPADVGSLTALWELPEQFTSLTPGGTYWFDLSGVYIPGDKNVSLPDNSLQWVPFTYAGTVNAYVLNKNSSGVTTASEAAASTTSPGGEYGYTYDHSLFIADYIVTHTVSWNELNEKDLIFGKSYTSGGVGYTLRAPSAGSNGDTSGGTPASNEWDAILDKNSDDIRNYFLMSSWGQDTSLAYTSNRAHRGYHSARTWGYDNAASQFEGLGFRPILEILNPGDLGADGLTTVTLNLNGGSIGSITGPVNLAVKSDFDLTLPGGTDVTRPDGNDGTYFKWQDSSGNLYKPGEQVPADVTSLTALWELPEQFTTLTPGGTYWFDLSGANIPGTVNDGNIVGAAAVPDKTLHWVPFTYAGTVDAYVLNENSNGVATASGAAANTNDPTGQYGYTYDHSLFIADYAVTHTVSWDTLNGENLIFGTTYTSGGVGYTLRAPSAGSSSTDSGGAPASNEWDAILDKNSGYIKNWNKMYSWGQDTCQVSNTLPRAHRGYNLARFWYGNNATYQDVRVGFRPVLELPPSDTLGSDGLTTVTLDLNGGHAGSDDTAVTVNLAVKSGGTYTAPSGVGLTRPTGIPGTNFKWQDSSGNFYRPGDTVPANVGSLTALWEKDVPTATANDITVTYTGSAVPASAITGTASVDGSWSFENAAPVNVADNSDSVTVVFTPADTDTYATVEDIIKVTINKATPTGTPAYTAITTSGKTLADAALTVGSITPDGGSIVWDLGDSQTVSANTAYNWTYTPAVADQANYNNLTGSIKPYVVSSSGGGGGGGGGVSTYAITISSAKNGDVTSSHKTSSKGTTVTLTVTPDKGYELDTLTVTDGSGNKVKVTEKNGKYTFTMPASKVTVKATFAEIVAEPENPFVDVPANAYYYDAVLWAAENGITGGVDDTHFAPNAPCTRAQIVTFLWRAAGSPVVNDTMNFSDVPANAYYAEAVRWAVSQGITKGTSDTTFSPDATCTRAQAMTFIYRSEQAQGGGMQGMWMSQNPFSDVDLESYYGEAVMWAVANGVTKGTSDTTFSPGADCTRAQIVTFLYRFFVK